MQRSFWIYVFVLLLIGSFHGNALGENTELIKPVHLEFFSPCPITANCHLTDTAVVKLLNRYHSRITASWRAIPLPMMLELIDGLPTEKKRYCLPTMTNIDFVPARTGAGHLCHKYGRNFTDLKFVASTGYLGFGVLTYNAKLKTPMDLIGMKIGVPPKPHSTRSLADAVLKDAWGIVEKVTLVDSSFSMVKEDLLSGNIDATFWVWVWEELGGFGCSDISVLDEKKSYWINLSPGDIERINKKNAWMLHRVLVPAGSIRASKEKIEPSIDVGLASLNLAICAWDNTDNEVIYELVRFLDEKSELWPEYTDGCASSLARMCRWPGLTEEMVHPGAMKYYREKGIEVGEILALPSLTPLFH